MENRIIKYCSPTLAGLKTGSLFCGDFRDHRDFLERFRRWNSIFLRKGLRAVPFQNKRGCILVYVYRISRLKADLNAPAARKILTRLGYSPECPEKCIARLRGRVENSPEFPHEIGLFLGYPPLDVLGFIEKRNCKFAGMWKVYGDEISARKQFGRFKKCTEIYCRLYENGRSIERLLVAQTVEKAPNARKPRHGNL